MRTLSPDIPIPRELLREAMAKDFEQHMINSYTPDRGYPFPTDHVEALLAKYWPKNPPDTK